MMPADVVTAQQTLQAYLTGYFTALSAQWTAVVDVANLLQIDDLYEGTQGNPDLEVSPLEQLAALIRFPQMTPGTAAVGAGLGRPSASPCADDADRRSTRR